MNAPPPQTVTYQLRRSYLVVGVIGAVFFAALAIGSSAMAFGNPGGAVRHPKLMALALVLFWSSFTALSFWVILAYFRERLVLGSTEITQHGVFRATTLRIAEIRQIQWTSSGFGRTLVISTGQAKAKVDLGSFTVPEQREIVVFFHEFFAPENQLGWPGSEEHRRKVDVEFVRRSRANRLKKGLAFAALAILFGAVGRQPFNLTCAVFCAGFAAWLLLAAAFGKRHSPPEPPV